MKRIILGSIAGGCIGLACHFLQPHEPDSMYGTALLVAAVAIYVESGRP